MPRLALTRARLVALLAASLTALGVLTPVAASASSRSAIEGPDVASYQHPNGARINWGKVAASSDFAIVKATEGTSYVNPWFRRDYYGARAAGLVRGSYHFARPGFPLVGSARKQARFYVDHLGQTLTTSRTLPPALDLELTGGLGRADLVTWAQSFLLAVRRLTGRTPMIYTYPSFWTGALGDPAALSRFPLWMASYGRGEPAATLWQYTSGAHVAGIRGAVDMSRFLDDPETWTSLSDGRIASPWPAAVPGAPVHVTGVPGDGHIDVSWLPGDAGSSDISSYVVTAEPGGESVTVDGVTHHATVRGLTNGQAYTVTVAAANYRGAGASSSPTSSLTPLVPTTLTPSPLPVITYGDDVTVHVQLSRPDTGMPLAGQPIDVSSRASDQLDWTSMGTQTTGPNGVVAVSIPAAQSSESLLFSYAAPTGTASARRTVPVDVRSGVSGHLSRHYVRRNHQVALRGRIMPATAGVRVLRELQVGSRWQVMQSTTTDLSGRYAFAFSPTVKATDRYRVVVTSFGNRARGYTPTLTLHVR